MSWSFKHIGTPDGVTAAINAETNLPQGLKDLAASVLSDAKRLGQSAVAIESHGHFGSGVGTIGKFELASFAFLPDPATPAVITTTPVSAQPIATDSGDTVAPAPAAS